MQNRDTQHYWEGVAEGELRIQRCENGHLRHPPRPSCPECQSLEWDTVVASGKGEVHSYVVHHYPPVPGLETPYAVVLVDLEEGVRVVGNVVGIEPEAVEVGMAVAVEFVAVDDELTLPMWRPTGDA